MQEAVPCVTLIPVPHAGAREDTLPDRADALRSQFGPRHARPDPPACRSRHGGGVPARPQSGQDVRVQPPGWLGQRQAQMAPPGPSSTTCSRHIHSKITPPIVPCVTQRAASLAVSLSLSLWRRLTIETSRSGPSAAGGNQRRGADALDAHESLDEYICAKGTRAPSGASSDEELAQRKAPAA